VDRRKELADALECALRSCTVEAADYYSGLVADAYAKLKSTSFAAQPYADFVRTNGQPGLEIGCGDGEPLLELCAGGLDVDGVDSSLDMVKRCRDNASRLRLNVDVHHQRVEDLALQRRYRSIYFAGPTFNLLPDDETACRALQRIGENLTDHGVAMIPLWIPEPTPPAEMGVSREAEDHGAVLRYTALSETYDETTRTRTTSARYEKVGAAAAETVDREWIIHWHTPDGFRALCDRAGMTVIRLADDITGADPTDTSESFTATLQRA